MEGVETATLGGSQTSKLQKLDLVVGSRTKTIGFERLKVVTLKGKMTQWPPLQSVLFKEFLDCEVLEAYFLLNGLIKLLDHRVHHLRRRAREVSNVNVGGGLKVVLLEPLLDGASRVLSPTVVYLHAIEYDLAHLDVLGTSEDDRGLIGHG